MAVITLTTPVEHNGQRFEALTIRPMDGKAIRLIDRAGIIGMCTDMARSIEAEATKAILSGADAKEAAESAQAAASLPTGLLDALAPVAAHLAGVPEAVIDRLAADDYMTVVMAALEGLPDSPLAVRKPTTG